MLRPVCVGTNGDGHASGNPDARAVGRSLPILYLSSEPTALPRAFTYSGYLPTYM